MMVSVVSAYCSPSGPSISATSSARPRAPGPASGPKKRAMRSNSPRRGAAATRSSPQPLGPERPGEAVEDAIDEARLLAGEESVRNVEIFADGDARRHLGTCQQLIGARAQDRPENDLEPLERPVGGQRRSNVLVELGAPRASPLDEHGKKRFIGRTEILAFGLRAEPMPRELAHRVGGRGAGDLDLIKRLNRCQPRG